MIMEFLQLKDKKLSSYKIKQILKLGKNSKFGLTKVTIKILIFYQL